MPVLRAVVLLSAASSPGLAWICSDAWSWVRPSSRPVVRSSGLRDDRLLAELLAVIYEELLNLQVNLEHVGEGEHQDDVCEGLEKGVTFGYLGSQNRSCGLNPAGNVSHIAEHGIYYFIPNWMEGDDTCSPSSSPPCYLDWYHSHVHEERLRSLFKPIDFYNRSVEAGGCTAKWNEENPLKSGHPWCDAKGRFVPPHCRMPGASCMELYHVGPWYLKGAVEALVTSYSLPYLVVYLGLTEHQQLPFHSRPFVAFGWGAGSGWSRWDDQNSKGKLVRIQFPVQASSCHWGSQGLPADPEASTSCDLVAEAVPKYFSTSFEQDYPAATLVLQRFELTEPRLQELRRLDEDESGLLAGEPAACRFLELHKAAIHSLLGKCTEADQPKDDLNGEDCACRPGQVYNGTHCTSCPPDSMCFDGRLIVPCGVPHAVVAAGRRRRALGPSHPEDCICAPGYGTATTFLNALYEGTANRGAGYAAAEDAALLHGQLNHAIPPVCQPCGEGVYKPNWDGAFCSRPCPSSSWSEAGSTSEDNCTCTERFFRAAVNPLRCDPCPPDSGIVCPSGQEPYAQRGWFLLIHGSLDDEQGRTVESFACPLSDSCIGGNVCQKGAGPPFCTTCLPGYVPNGSLNQACWECKSPVRVFFALLVMVIGLTLYANYFGSLIGRGSQQDINMPSMVLKVLFNNAFLCWPLMAFYLTSFAAPDSWLVDELQHSQRCAQQMLGFKSPPAQAVSSMMTLVIYPAMSLFFSWLWYKAKIHHIRKWISKQRAKADHVCQLLNMCEWLEDLHLRDEEKMKEIKAELRALHEDIVDRSRISGIWRSVLGREEAQFRDFLWDSVGLIFCWLVLLHPIVSRDILLVMPAWQPYGWTEYVVLRSDYPQLTGFSAFPLWAAFVIYGLGFPFWCFWKVRSLFWSQRLMQKDQYKIYGYLYYGFEVKSPAVYGESVLMMVRFVMTLLVDELPISNPNGAGHGLTVSLGRPISLFTLVTFCWNAPWEKMNRRSLDGLMALTILKQLLATEMQRDAKRQNSLGSDLMVPQVISFASVIYTLKLVMLLLLSALFWSLVFREVFREWLDRLVERVTDYLGDDGWNPQERTRCASLVNALAKVLMFFYKKLVASHERTLSLTVEARPRTNSYKSERIIVREIRLHERRKPIVDMSRGRRIAFMRSRLKLSHPPPGPSQMHAFGRAGGVTRLSIPRSKANQVRLSRTSQNSWEVTVATRTRASRAVAADKTIDTEAARRIYDVQGRGNLAKVLSEAIETLLVVQNLESLPFCVLEFILVDAQYFATKGGRLEQRRRQEVFDFVWNHPSGQVKGLEELFEGVGKSPTLSARLRVYDLKEIASKLSSGHITDKIYIRDLQRYVRHLRYQDRATLEQAIDAFAKAFLAGEPSVQAKEGEATHRRDRAAQTGLQPSQFAQTDTPKGQQTQTESYEESILRRRPGDSLNETNPHVEDHEDMLLLREQLAAATREAKLLELEGTWLSGRAPAVSSAWGKSARSSAPAGPPGISEKASPVPGDVAPPEVPEDAPLGKRTPPAPEPAAEPPPDAEAPTTQTKKKGGKHWLLRRF